MTINSILKQFAIILARANWLAKFDGGILKQTGDLGNLLVSTGILLLGEPFDHIAIDEKHVHYALCR